ncbi:MAG: helix-turn-helix domain-containing protein [Bacteroidota bacterium]|nr:helix-turn-helix domain-containing protein [Bacteroidota bacterium]
MNHQAVLTLINPLNGHLAFKIFPFEDNSYFDHLQRLNYYSIILITQGEGRIKADFSEYDFSGKTIMFFSPYQPYMILSKKELKGFSINFHPDFFCIHKHQKEVACNGILFNNIYQPPFFSIEPADTQKFETLIQQMETEMQNTELAQYELLISYLKVFLITASRIKISGVPEAEKEFAGNKEPFILQNLKDAIETHYRTKHSASDYANLLNISAKALAKICKTYFNKTLTDLISERIIIEAKRELYLTSKTIKAIAYELGFNDEYYFSRFFKNNADVAPQLYRETVGFARDKV